MTSSPIPDSFRSGDRGFFGGQLGLLHITLLRAHELLLTDEEGENDSYCEFIDTNGTVVGQSCIIESLNPDWDDLHKRIQRSKEDEVAGQSMNEKLTCSCQFGRGLFARTQNTVTYRLKPADAMKFVALRLWDEDPFGRDFNGEARIDIKGLLASIQKGAPLDGIVKASLLPRVDEIDPEIAGKAAGDLGTVTYRYLWEPKDPPADEGDLKALVRSAPMGCIPLEPLPEVERRQWIPCAFRIRIISCRWLLNRDAVGLSDPYVTVSDADDVEVMRTPVIDDTLCPDWSSLRSEALVHVKTLGETRGDITLRVWDADTSGSDFLGEVCLPIANLMACAETGRGELTCLAQLQPRPNEKDRVILAAKDFLGAIAFTYELMDLEDISDYKAADHPAAALMLPRTLAPAHPFCVTLHLRRCSYLPSRNSLDIPNPYVEVRRFTAGSQLASEGELIYTSAVSPKNVSPDIYASVPALTLWEGVPEEDAARSEALRSTYFSFTIMNKCKVAAVGNNAGDMPIAGFTASLLEILQRVNYALVSEGGGGAHDEKDCAIGIQLLGGAETIANAPRPVSASANQEGTGAAGSLYLWATSELPAADALDLSRCMPMLATAAKTVAVFVWGCEGLNNPRVGPSAVPSPVGSRAPRCFMRVYLDGPNSGARGGSEIIRTIAVEGTDPVFGRRGVVGYVPLPALGGLEEALSSQLITFTVVDENPFSDVVLGACTVSLGRLLQHVAHSTFSLPRCVMPDGLPFAGIKLLGRGDLERKTFGARSLASRANVLGHGKAGVVKVWASLQQ